MATTLLLLFLAGGLLTESSAGAARHMNLGVTGESSVPETKYEGEVAFYEPGKKLAIRLRPQVEVTYDLTDTKKVYHIPPDLHVGDQVICSEQSPQEGTKVILVTVKTKHTLVQ